MLPSHAILGCLKKLRRLLHFFLKHTKRVLDQPLRSTWCSSFCSTWVCGHCWDASHPECTCAAGSSLQGFLTQASAIAASSKPHTPPSLNVAPGSKQFACSCCQSRSKTSYAVHRGQPLIGFLDQLLTSYTDSSIQGRGVISRPGWHLTVIGSSFFPIRPTWVRI